MSAPAKLSTFALMSDDVELAMGSSRLCWKQSTFLPVLNMPRLFRPDWPVELQKRIAILKKAGINKIFNGNDSPQPVVEIFRKSGFVVSNKENFRESLINPTSCEPNLKTLDAFVFSCGYRKRISRGGIEYLTVRNGPDNSQPPLSRLMVLELSSGVSDIAAINYARYFEYDFMVIGEIPQDVLNEFETMFTDFNDGPDVFAKQKHRVTELVNSILPLYDIQNEYSAVQLLIRDVPIGIVFESIPAAHLFQVDIEIKLLSDIVDLQANETDSTLPSYLFVDLQENDLQSEVPQIVADISKHAQWRFHLNGRRATVTAFRLFCQFFPIDFLMVSGHGGSPRVRIAEFEFKDEKGNPHIIKVREFFQILREVNEMYEVESKYEFLSVDGVDWADKEEVRKRGLSIRGFLGNREESKLLSSENIDVKNLQGLVLSNGVFMGNIHFSANNGSPVLFLNTCGSLANAGNILSFAGARAIIGTAWSILDSDAVIFAKKFFDGLCNTNLAGAFFEARKSILNEYSKFSYWFVGTLNSSFTLGLDKYSASEQGRIMASRMISAFEMARFMFEKKWLDKEDFRELLAILSVISKYFNKVGAIPRDVVLRLNQLRKEVERDT